MQCSVADTQCSIAGLKCSIAGMQCPVAGKEWSVSCKENHRAGKKDDGFMSRCVKFTHLDQIVGADVRRFISNAECGMWIVEYK
jgi:hypothetical protein